MRIYLLYALTIAVAVLALKRWFWSLCALILLTCVLQRKDMPGQLASIQGLNPWNFLFVWIGLCWLFCRHAEGLRWDLPSRIALLLLIYLLVLIIADVRALAKLSYFPDEYRQSTFSFLTDELINPVKFMLLGLLLYDGCRTRRRIILAIFTILATFLFYALLTIRCMPFEILQSESQFMRYRQRIDRDTGLNANDMGMVLAAGFWALLSAWRLSTKSWFHGALLVAAATVAVGLALTFSRGGYLAFIVLAVVFAALFWRRLFLLYPFLVLVVLVFMPSIRNRMSMGLSTVTAAGEQVSDTDVMTSGRATELWPFALRKIRQSPLVGYGRRAIVHTNAPFFATHPHNAYLEVLLDTGIIGLIPIAILFLGILRMSVSLLRSGQALLIRSIGGMSLACIVALLVCGLAAQSFFTMQSMMAFWCVWALALRCRQIQRQARRQVAPQDVGGRHAQPHNREQNL